MDPKPRARPHGVTALIWPALSSSGRWAGPPGVPVPSVSPGDEGGQGPCVDPAQRQPVLGLHVGQHQLQHLVPGGRGSPVALVPLASLQDGQQVQQAQQHRLVWGQMGNLSSCSLQNTVNPNPVTTHGRCCSPDRPECFKPVTCPGMEQEASLCSAIFLESPELLCLTGW